MHGTFYRRHVIRRVRPRSAVTSRFCRITRFGNTPLGRITPKPPNWLSRCRFSRIRNVKLPCVHVPLNSRIVGQQKAGREPSLGTSVRNERPVTHISSERDFCPLPFGSLASRCVFLSAYGLCDWK